MKIKTLVLGVVACVSLSSCGVMGYVVAPTVYVPGGKEVSAVRSNTNILTLTPMNAETVSDEMIAELSAQCENGIKNIKTSNSIKSLSIITMEKLEISGNCR